jgi:hypothetical protein
MDRLKVLCKIKEEKKFEARLKELEKIFNNDANVWLFEQLSKKSKCALTFNRGDCRYGIMTTNISEMFIVVLQAITPQLSVMKYESQEVS